MGANGMAAAASEAREAAGEHLAHQGMQTAYLEWIATLLDLANNPHSALTISESATAGGGATLTIPVRPSPGMLWVVQTVGIVTDATAGRAAVVGMGERPLLQPIATLATNALGCAAERLGGLVVPPTMSLSVLLDSAIPAGTDCIFHVTGRELAPPEAGPLIEGGSPVE